MGLSVHAKYSDIVLPLPSGEDVGECFDTIIAKSSSSKRKSRSEMSETTPSAKKSKKQSKKKKLKK